MLLVLCFCSCVIVLVFFFFFKQKTAYEMRISDWSSDVCSSDLIAAAARTGRRGFPWAPRCPASAGAADGLPPRTARSRPCPAGSGVRETQIGRASCRERVCQYV